MVNLRKAAKGQPCYLRLPGCSHQPEQTVLCHLRIGGIAGVGQKPPDVCAVPLDHFCHGVADGRIKTAYSRQEIDAELLRAQNQWLAYLWQNGRLKVV